MSSTILMIKCVVVGDGAVGKTSLLMSYTTNEFPKEYVPTIFDNYVVKKNYNGRECMLGLFDTAGQETYDHLRPLAYLKTDVFLVCFSVVLPQSFENIKDKWVPEIRHHVPNCKFLLVGTQIDLRNDPIIVDKLAASRKRPIKIHEGEMLAKQIGAVKYVECSSLTMYGVQNVFEEVIIAASEPPVKNKIFRCNAL